MRAKSVSVREKKTRVWSDSAGEDIRHRANDNRSNRRGLSHRILPRTLSDGASRRSASSVCLPQHCGPSLALCRQSEPKSSLS